MPLDMKNRIADTFLVLAKKKNIDKITVTELVETCGISRQTFYYHFQDILDVIEWYAHCSMEQAFRCSLNASSPEEAMGIIVTMVQERSDLFRKLYDSQKRVFVENLFLQLFKDFLREVGSLRSFPGDMSVADAEMMLHFYACGLAGVFLEYCDRPDADSEDIASRICKVLKYVPMLESEN